MPSLRPLAETLLARFQRLRALPGFRRAAAIFQGALLVAVLAYLIWRLSRIGWGAVLDNLPASPWFYALLVAKMLSLPVTELFTYQIIWKRPLGAHFPAFIRKRVYNNAVAGYSGEAFLALWAKRNLAMSERQALISVKDSNVLAALSANIATVGLVAWLAATGGLAPAANAIPGGGALFAIACGTAAAVSLGVIVLRRRLISLSGAEMRAVFALHAGRQIAQILIFAAVYAAALPAIPFPVWISFVALQYVLTRIPFLPNQELVYLTAALSLGAIVAAPQEAVAGMLLAEAALLQALYFLLFLATAHLAQRPRSPEAVEPPR